MSPGNKSSPVHNHHQGLPVLSDLTGLDFLKPGLFICAFNLVKPKTISYSAPEWRLSAPNPGLINRKLNGVTLCHAGSQTIVSGGQRI